MEKKELTVKEALEQGYRLYVYSDTHEFSNALSINKPGYIQWERGPMLLEKEPSLRPYISKETIAEILSEHVYSDWGDRSGDDNDELADIVQKLDYTPVATMVNDAVSKIHAYEVTDIKLIKG